MSEEVADEYLGAIRKQATVLALPHHKFKDMISTMKAIFLTFSNLKFDMQHLPSSGTTHGEDRMEGLAGCLGNILHEEAS